MLGRLNYMAPSRSAGNGRISGGDSFSFGVVRYQLLGGKKAFEGTRSPTRSRRSCRRSRHRYPTLDATLPQAFTRIIERALSKSRDGKLTVSIDFGYRSACARKAGRSRSEW